MTRKAKTVVPSSPAQIYDWAVETFGRHPADGIAIRANIELSELLSAISNNAPPEKIRQETADVHIVIAQVPFAMGVDGTEWAKLLLDKRPSEEVTRILDALPAEGASTFLAAQCLRTMSKILDTVLIDAGLATYWTSVLLSLAGHICGLFGGDLQTEIEAKMAINVSRKWGKTETGHFQHV